MPEQESPPPPEIVWGELLKRLELVKATAEAQAVDVPDTRALEGEDTLFVEGKSWEQWLSKQLFRARIALLLALFLLVLLWIISIPGLLLMVAYRYKGFTLSDPVIIAYMTTTTVSVIGLFKIAASWLFSDVGVKPK